MREDVTKNGVPLYAKGGEVEVKPTNYDPNLQRKHPELEAAIRGIAAGTTTHKQLDKLIAKHKPIKPYEFVPQPATDDDAERALKPAQKPKWRAHEQWPAGRKVGLRLDIPAYETHGVWVNSVHDEEGKGDDNLKVAYGPVSSVKNAVFDPTPHKAEEVGMGEKGKSSFARIKGDLHHMSEDEAVEHMKTHLNDPDYAQVGFDPRRHGHFYDRKTMKPVTHSAHVVQIGPLVLAHKPTYGKRENYAKGGSTSRAKHDANLAKFLAESKVKDRLYHGTDKDFSEFKFNPKKSMGTWLTNRPKLASAYSEVSARGGDNSAVYPLYAQIKNPASEKDFMDARDIAQAQSAAEGWHDHTIRHKQLLLDKGFDGVKLKDGTYIAFEPTQIKSATGNRGTYNPNDPDITKAKGGSIKPVGYTKERVTVSPNLDAMRYELESVKHYSKKVK